MCWKLYPKLKLKYLQDKEEEEDGNNSEITITEYAGNINLDIVVYVSNLPTSNLPISNPPIYTPIIAAALLNKQDIWLVDTYMGAGIYNNFKWFVDHYIYNSLVEGVAGAA
jgi:hypothetical protein